ncbi:MAG: HlyD family type I secretion periplasmic adaptor subunit [bacterium]|nr:HlyD family type I secretion periplasmic adaptor subunit [bacterium]
MMAEWGKRLFAAAEQSPSDFAAPLLRIQQSPPHPLGRRVLLALACLLAGLLIWSIVGRLDIVAVAEGKLVPQSYVKIVQPPESGIVLEILVHEGEPVRAGQVLMRMDALPAEADSKSVEAELARKRLTLKRIDAELNGTPLLFAASDSPALAAEITAQYRANRAAVESALAEERTRLAKANAERAAAERVRQKLQSTLPHYQEQEQAFEKLSKQGFAGPLMASDKRRERLEKEEDLRAQEHLIDSAQAGIAQSERKLVQIESDSRKQLFTERNEIHGNVEKLSQESAKLTHRRGLLELRASQDGVVKDLATHTTGTVVQPGTVMLTLVPKGELLKAEVWVSNEDIGFVRTGQPVKVKLAAFPFQKYGMVDGVVEHVGADALDANAQDAGAGNADRKTAKPLTYKALVALKAMSLEAGGERLDLGAGMQATAEIALGHRSVMEYLLSPVQKAWHEAGRER